MSWAKMVLPGSWALSSWWAGGTCHFGQTDFKSINFILDKILIHSNKLQPVSNINVGTLVKFCTLKPF